MTRTEVALDTLLPEVTAVLGAAGHGDARRLAARLVEDLAGVHPHGAGGIRPDQADRVRQAAARVAGGAPLAYATGRAGFRYLDLDVNPDVLIPRPETEGLVQLVIDWAGSTGRSDLRGLELGVGSGCVILSLAREAGFAQLVGVDVSAAAVATARRNVAREQPPARIDLMCGSWLDAVAPTTKFDVVVSNPPYLTDAEVDETERSVRDFEPHLALAAGPDGLRATERIASGARRVMVPGGLLALEIDARRGAETAGLVAGYGYREVRVLDDLFGRPRYLLALAGYGS